MEKVSTCATTLLITKLSGGSQSASISRSSQAPRRSMSATVARQRAATSSCRSISVAGSSARSGGKSVPSMAASQTSLVNTMWVSTSAIDSSGPSKPSTELPGRRVAR